MVRGVKPAESEPDSSISAYRPPNAHVADPRDSAVKVRHSGLGIASFVVSCVSGLLILILLVVAGVVEMSTPDGMTEESPIAIAIGLLLFLFVFLTLIGLGLGIAGLFQSERKKVFAVLGTIFGGLTLLGTSAIMLIGLSMG